MSGSTSYKIKYFGFDDLSESESDSDDEDNSAAKERKKDKKAATAMSTSTDSPQSNHSQESQQSQSSTITGSQTHLIHRFLMVPVINLFCIEFSLCLVFAMLSDSQESLDESGSQKERQGKGSDKSKEIGRKIFSGPKKVSQRISNCIVILNVDRDCGF